MGGGSALLAAFSALAGHPVTSWVLAYLWPVVAGALLLWSGGAKVRRPQLAAFALRDFGVIAKARRGFGAALGIFELAVAFLLLTGWSGAALHQFAVLIAALTFSTFAVLTAYHHFRGHAFPCYCFGSRGELGLATVLRNIGLSLVGWLAVLPGLPEVAPPQLILAYVAGPCVLAISVLLARVPSIYKENSALLEPIRPRRGLPQWPSQSVSEGAA
jgi:hypothetical protein